jgi:hypothetical protein
MRRLLSIPMLPPSKNSDEVRDRWKHRNVKAEWEEHVWARVNTFPRMPRPLQQVKASARVFWDKPGPLPDHFNVAILLHEAIADALVYSKVLETDAGDHYVAGPVTVVRADKPSTEIVLEWD